MKSKLFQKLAARYIACVFVLLFTVMTAFGFYLHGTQVQNEKSKSAASTQTTLKNISLALEEWIDGQTKLARQLAHNADVIAACAHPTDTAVVATAQQYLQKIHDIYGYYENIPLAVHTPDGNAVTLFSGGKMKTVKDGTFFSDTVNGKTIGKGGIQLSYIKASREGKAYFISQVYPSLLRGNPIFVIAAPVYDAGRHVGTVILAPQMDYFTDMFIKKTRIGKTGHIFFVDDRGMFIAHKDKRNILNTNAGQGDYLKRIVNKDTQFTETDSKGHTIRYLCRNVNIPAQNIMHDWTLCAAQDQKEIIAEADDFARLLGYGGGVLLLVLAGALYLLTRYLVTRPLAQVVRYARDIEQGNTDSELTLRRKDEIGVLAETLRNMTVHMIGRLREEKAFTQGILDGIRNPFAVVDTELKMHTCSQSMLATTGRSGKPDDYKGMGVAEFLFSDKTRHVVLEDVLADGQPRHNLPLDYTNSKGEAFEMLIDVDIVRDVGGNILGGITFWNDVTELKKRQRAIEGQKNRIEEAAYQAKQVSSGTETIVRTLTNDLATSSQRTEQQKGRLLETVTAVDELSATIQEIARNTAETARNAQDTRQKADDGVNVVRNSMQSILALQEQVAVMQNDLDQLNKQAEGIGSVIEIINDIADQTNLLALNAAIEAARAGEAGRGFSVVADEVRKLAEKTMTATSEVEQAIAAIQRGTHKCTDSIANIDAEATQSVTSSKQTDAALAEIATMAETTSAMIDSIATAAEQQSAATEQIAQTAAEVGAIAEETHLAMQQSEKNVQDVEDSFHQLHGLITSMH
ncbi:methyl-accepting chemotaxis protein [Pseudodesulfovibrio senegalensis]|uniref:HAMP domain-containing protein n=1 Tax=Pseudodesulfovibrio senegalensis TaxID=1721087 RepID=A0A6N6MZZ2_9BACT|nr:methyl-accepting chemotaxis protein [Pseudodesulfovibrio senegalensis]KAB1440265.1 HAMP domain-containing protein [Pseudodesulfovibrio senegalensis]